jgi:GTP-binding protein EngB required for normal cell division
VGLLDDLRRIFADAEVSLVGGRDERLEAERALEARDWFRARAAAKRLLDRAPHSPIGLALLADACEGAGLDAELEVTLAELSRIAGSSPDVWLRLGRVRTRVGAPSREVREALVRAIAWTDDFDPEKRFSARQARLILADLELAEGNAVRAEGWLAPLGDGGDVRRRRLASAIARRATGEIGRLLVGFEPEVGDAEGQRLVGEGHRTIGNAAAAVRALSRAAILEATEGSQRAAESLREAVACAVSLDEASLRAAEAVADELKVRDVPLWRAALSAARGDAKSAAIALREATAAGASFASPADRASARALAINARDVELLARVASDEIDRTIQSAAAARDPESANRALDLLLSDATERADAQAEAWLSDLAKDLVRLLVPASSPAHWDDVLGRMSRHARGLADLDALRKIELLAAERARPVRIAIVGEFNAGKSTFVNALLGMDVAPTGILPTTAVPHVLRYGPDPIARARLREGGARTVPPERLKSLLAELGDKAITEVEVEVPFPYLQRVEIVDTPGFNAPDPEHAKTAMDTLVEGSGVDVAIWLFDANQALKTSERRILEAIVARGIPVQALLNKADRMSAEDLARVTNTFVEDAKSIGLTSWRPPLAFSAKSAFKARMAQSDDPMFGAVRALMEDELPAHQATLKERGLRRRAHDLVAPLHASADRAHAEKLAERDAKIAASGALVADAAILDRAAALDAGAQPTPQDGAADEVRRIVRDELRNAIDAFRRERDELAMKDHPATAPYLERRLVELLEVAAGRAVATATAKSNQSRDALGAIALDATAVARGFAAGSPDLRSNHRGDVEGPLVRAVLSVVANRLRMTSQATFSGVSTLPRARELAAFHAVLAPTPAPGAQQT